MIWFIIALIGALIGAFMVFTDPRENHRIRHSFSCFVFTLLIASCFAMIPAMFGGLIVYGTDNGKEVTWLESEIDIVSFGDGASSIQGEFYLFGGYINSEQVYLFYKNTQDGGIVQGNIPADQTVIYETDSETPRIETFYNKFTDCNNLAFWGIKSCEEYYDPRTHKVYVPEGSVVRDFTLDAD